MSLPNEITPLLVSTTGGYRIERSLRFNSADSAYLNRTPAGAGNRRMFTCSAWVKRTGILASLIDVPLLSAGDGTSFGISGTGALGATYDGRFYIRNGGANLCRIPSALFRDPTAWYHFVFVVDTANATPADRQILYVNGVRQESFDGSFTQNTDTNINTATVHTIGVGIVITANASYSGNFLLTEYNFIDGQALTASSFGEISATTGVWQPKKYAGTYGTNGFYLKFADNSGTTATTLGKDSSGNGNNWTPNNFSVTAGSNNDSLVDTPTLYGSDTGLGGEVRGNYCTFNPIAGSMSISNGSIYAYNPYASYPTAFATVKIGTNFSPVYWEGIVDSGTSQSSGMVWGLTAGDSSVSGSGIYGSFTDAGNSLVYNASVGTLFYPGGIVAGTVLQFAFDPSTGKIWLGKNNSWYNSSGGSTGNPSTGANPTATIAGVALTPYVQAYANGININFGQRPFAYTAPSGFKALCTTNLPEPGVVKSSTAMSIATYTGTGSSLTPTSGLGFSPDLVWIKGRSGATDSAFYDTTRGVQQDLVTNSTAAETTQAQGLTAFNSNGFSVGTLAKVNTSAQTYVAWCWDKSTAPGLDIVTYTGNGANRTIAHSLGVAPSMILIKQRNGSTNWIIWNSSIPATNYIPWTYAGSSTSGTTYWNSTAPTSSVFSLGTATDVNANAGTYVAYLWTNVEGFSRIGVFTGNGSSDGPFVYCGFKPKWVMLHSGDSWLVYDSTRSAANPTGDVLWSNLSNSESASYAELDFLSNGFKLRNSSTSNNTSGGTVYFMAFAESPFKYSLAR